MNSPNVLVMAHPVYYPSQKCMESLQTGLDAQLFPKPWETTHVLSLVFPFFPIVVKLCQYVA